LVIADLPGRQRRGDLAQQGFHQRRQLLLLWGKSSGGVLWWRNSMAGRSRGTAARCRCAATGKAVRLFRDFRYSTLDSWSRKRRVVGKAEHTP